MEDINVCKVIMISMLVVFGIITFGLWYLVHTCTKTMFVLADKLEEEREKNKELKQKSE